MDYRISGSILGSPYFGKLPYDQTATIYSNTLCTARLVAAACGSPPKIIATIAMAYL